MNQVVSPVFVLVFLIGMPVSAISSPMIEIKKHYYQVGGSTADEIRSELTMKTPIEQDGVKYDAHTSWKIRWNLWWYESGGRCEIQTVEVSLDVQYVLPKLKDPESLPDPLKQKWKTYVKALMRHEKGHKDMGVRAAREIENAIRKMEARSSCKQLENDANRTGHKILKKYNKFDREYDRKSNHGMNNGAVFP